MATRLLGIDVARALALFGMILVNFKLVMGAKSGQAALLYFAGLFEGRASALFVILAGIGLSILTNKAMKSDDPFRLNLVRKQIIKRGLLLLAIGLLYTPIWPADILHFYGLYFLVAACVFNVSSKHLLWLCVAFVFGFVELLFWFDYEHGWNWETLDYTGLWTGQGMIRHMLFNGFHPVFPWVAFLLFGMWLGRQNFANKRFQRLLAKCAVFIFVGIEGMLYMLRAWLEGPKMDVSPELVSLLTSNMMPPMPYYMVSATSTAVLVIIGCLYLADRYQHAQWVNALAKTGQLSLTFYVLHVILGMGTLEALGLLGKQTIEMALMCAFVFCGLSVLLSIVWLSFFRSGPLEAMFRRLAK